MLISDLDLNQDAFEFSFVEFSSYKKQKRVVRRDWFFRENNLLCLFSRVWFK